MRKHAATKIALLALMLAVSHIALISHVTAHFEPELEQCELCVSQAQLLSAMPAPGHFAVIDVRLGLANFNSQQCSLPEQSHISFHQRAPPIQSA